LVPLSVLYSFKIADVKTKKTMCGRYSVNPKAKGLSRAVKLLEKAEAEARYNAAPSQGLPVITEDKPNEVQFFQWGLLPHWASGPDYHPKSVNARAETLSDKATFKQLLKRHRCLVPADGFYEWKKVGKTKIPYRILLRSEELFTFAGLWDEWADKETGEIKHTFTIITTEANELVKPLHDRMPVLLHPEEEKLWLAEAPDSDHLKLLHTYPAEEMKLYQVSQLINSPTHDSPEVLEPETKTGEQGSLF
jgi:putative SOS response-associated peptidase YedK